MQRSTPVTAWLVAALIVTAAFGCRRAAEETGEPVDGGPRIVSLSPALSRTLVDFGLGDRVVGRTGFCRALDPGIPVVGDLYEIDYERLIRVEPTHILVQPPASGLDPRLESLAEQRGWTVGQWTLDSIDDIEQAIRTLPAVLYDDGAPGRAEAAHRAAELLNGIATALTTAGAATWTGSTLMAASADPVLAVGRKTYLHDILTALGGRNAVSAEGWAELSLEDVLRMNPEAIIVVVDHGPVDVDPLEAAGALGELDTTARREGRIVVLHHPDAHLPSSGVIGVAGEMRRVLVNLAGAAPG